MTENRQKIQFLQWNCRSISTNILHFTHYIEENDFCVLALQSLNTEETKLPKITNYFYPPLFTCDTETQKVQTAIYIRSDLSYSQLNPLPYADNINDMYATGACVKFNQQCIINVISVYFPRGPKDENTDWIKNINFNNKNWAIMGDFNAHSSLWEKDCSSTTSNRLVENIVDSPLLLLNDCSITRVPDSNTQRPTAIDLSLLSACLAVDSNWYVVDDCLGSDHLPIIIEINDITTNEDSKLDDKIPKFCYSRANWDSFRDFLLSYDTCNIANNDIDIYYENITRAVISAAEHAIPKVKNSTKNKHYGKGWWSSTCAEAVAYKKETYKQWIRNRCDDNFINMKRAKLNCKNVIALAKQQHWDDFCKSEVTESKNINKVWKKVKELKNGTILPSYPLKLNNSIFPSTQEKAKAFLNYFTENSLSSSLNPEIINYRKFEEAKESYSDPLPDQNHYLNAAFTLDELKEALSSFTSNSTAVGLDGISYQMLINFPPTWIQILHTFYQTCWQNGAIPTVWKKSVVVPIPKEGKVRSAVDSYRPIALTSNVAKVMEKIVLKRLLYHCDKNNIIPTNQAGFRKGRNTMDHLVKLSNNIKKQFARRKSCLATFCDIRKAYDRVWHARLLFKLRNIGINGIFYQYIKSFLSEREICTRVGRVYSDFKRIDMGIPQGSIISPTLFTILIHDLPDILSKGTKVVQYADDVAIWVNTSLRKHTSQRMVLYVQKLYQLELDKLSLYMEENGLELSGEKTCLLLFNNGHNPKSLPKLYIDGKILEYKQSVKFLGVHFTSKLKWKIHIEYLLNKARKRLNLLKVILSQPWSQNTDTLLHLSLSLIRSTLVYGQEVYFSASQTMLKKLTSLDCRAIKLAIGVPIHASTAKSYKEAGILPLCDQRKLAVSKYVVRSLSVPNSVSEELFFNAHDYPLRAQNIPYLQQSVNYIDDITSNCNIDLASIPILPSLLPIPPWELMKANFDIDYTDYKKNEETNILVNVVKMHMSEMYSNYLKIYTDGSVLESSECGSGFVIPDLMIKRSYHLGKGFTIFTAELYAILMALCHILHTPLAIFNILVCVDSRSVLYALRGGCSKIRPDIVLEILYTIHCIKTLGIGVVFSWVPSHCGIYWNDICDRLAKEGAENSESSVYLNNLLMSSHELTLNIEHYINKTFRTCSSNFNFHPRQLTKILYKLRTNSWKTKYVKDILCDCGSTITIQHIVCDCPILSDLYKEKGVVVTGRNLDNILYSSDIVVVAQVLMSSVVYQYL